MLKYRRILLKLSGESLMGEKGFGIDASMLSHYADQIRSLVDMGVEVAIVIGGGNIFRGPTSSSKAPASTASTTKTPNYTQMPKNSNASPSTKPSASAYASWT